MLVLEESCAQTQKKCNTAYTFSSMAQKLTSHHYSRVLFIYLRLKFTA